jgi:hypothetical protein
MNLQRGLFRLWLLLSVLWVGFMVWVHEPPCLFGKYSRNPYCAFSSPVNPASEYLSFAAGALGPPIAILLLGYSLLWVLKGFRRDV